MKRNFLLTVLLLAVSIDFCSGSGFWTGIKVVHFIPTFKKAEDNVGTFLGAGIDVGWAFRYVDLSLDANWVSAKMKSEGFIGANEEGKIHFIMATERIAYRPLKSSTPYFGVGSGYHLGFTTPHSWDTEQSISLEPFLGYDFHLFKQGGIRIEEGYQITQPTSYHLQPGLRSSLGIYLKP